MSKRSNFSGDLEQLWFANGTRQRTYRQIVSDAEEGKSPLVTQKDAREQAQSLRELIEQNAQTTEESFGNLEHNMMETYLATRDFSGELAALFGLTVLQGPDGEITGYEDGQGTHYESIYTKILADAESISEEYSSNTTTALTADIEGVNQALFEAVDLWNGEIRRGFIIVGGVRYFGIVISSRNVFKASGTTYVDGADTYYEIATDTGNCYGLYTATGWQFWRGNQRLGWFDTEDGQLHVGNINIEEDLQMGDWRLINGGTAFGIKYVG